MSENVQGFKRINFFKGFLTTEKDWNDAERYHIDKRRLHNRMMHSPGVIHGYAGELKVTARARGDLSVEVQSGYAIDGMGNDLMIHDATIRNINLEEFKLPQTIYIVLRYYEELTDFIAYKENLEYKGHRRVLESCKVELSQTEPDIAREVELARVYLEKGVSRVRDARDPQSPQANEIDMRYVPRGGAFGSMLPGHLRLRLEQLLWAVRRGALEYTRRGVIAAHDVVQACNTALMLLYANLLDLRNVFEIFRLIIDCEGEMSLDVDVHHPTIAQKKEFSEYRRQVEILRGLLAEGKNNMDAYMNLLAYQAKCAEIAMSAVAGEKPQIEAPAEKKDAPKAVDIKDWEGVKVMPAPKPQMDLEGTSWVLVDEIEILNKESEDKLLNITPNRPVVVLRRMDYVYGDYELEMAVNGKKSVVVSCVGTDRVHRWRNWPAMIPADAVTGDSLIVRQQSITAGRDINMFHIWVYQPK
jgi:hypothetical protein